MSLSVITVIIVICYTSSSIVRIVQIKEGWTFLMKPSREERWWNWTWFSTTGTQQLHQDQHLLQTVATGRTRYISRELRMQ